MDFCSQEPASGMEQSWPAAHAMQAVPLQTKVPPSPVPPSADVGVQVVPAPVGAVKLQTAPASVQRNCPFWQSPGLHVPPAVHGGPDSSPPSASGAPPSRSDPASATVPSGEPPASITLPSPWSTDASTFSTSKVWNPRTSAHPARPIAVAIDAARTVRTARIRTPLRPRDPYPATRDRCRRPGPGRRAGRSRRGPRPQRPRRRRR
jgi:hypothetical protein